ncbi:MAG: glucose 1-dehydrogenase [Acidobacteria bacterium]|nr:glucose 1-dehydrogenase [Acidobacteriota bacterium]
MKNDCLTDKVAVVTGARRGIGRAVAVTFAGAGADVVVCDIVDGDGGLKETEEAVKKLGSEALALKTDISLRDDVERMALRALEVFGRIDVLVNCAGVWIPGETLVECGDEHWDAVMNTNLKGTFLCCREVGRRMIAQRSGCIINLSSQVGRTPAMGAGAYSTSKAGIIMLTMQMAQEMARYKVRVNALAPGIVKTEFNAGFWKGAELEKQASGMVPLGRLAETEDIARAALFLASDAAGYITGEVIGISGGWSPTSSVAEP